MGSQEHGSEKLRREVTRLNRRVAELEQSLGRSARLRSLVDNLPLVAWTTDHELCFTSADGKGLKALRLSPGRVVGRTVFQVFQSADLSFPPIAAHLQALQGNLETYGHHWRNRTYQAYLAPILDQGAVAGVAGLGLDVTEQAAAQEALRKSEESLRALVESSRDGILTLDTQRRITGCNSAFLDMFGYGRHEVLGRSVLLIHNDEQGFHELGRLIQSQAHRLGSWRFEWEFRRKDGTPIPCETVTSVMHDQVGRVAGYVSIMRDISQRRREEAERQALQAQLRQAQKMEAMGTLAGGIAHDFNNILGAIIGFAEMAREDLPENSSAREELGEVLLAGERARNLIRQILAFSRRTEQERRPVSLTPLIKETIKLLRASLPSSIDIASRLLDQCPPILADPTEVHQVLMNLCTNAAHAMRDQGGRLEIALEPVEVTEADRQIHADLKPSPHLALSVSDTGTGMTPEVLERIYDPFFTTKGPGEGTGMGLSVALGIVKSLRGDIQVTSALGRGSTFRVLLPVTGQDSAHPHLEEEDAPRGEGRVLLVDDEPPLVELGKRMLGRLGYEVAAFPGSLEALTAFRRDPQAFDLVITDLTMPKMSGAAMAQEMLRLRPGLPVVICTGFGEAQELDAARRMGIREVVLKPLVKRDLARAAARALGQVPIKDRPQGYK